MVRLDRAGIRLIGVSMKGEPSPGVRHKGSQPNGVESLSEAAIKNELRSDVIQHPTTIPPLAVSLISVIYLLLLSPNLGGELLAMVLCGVLPRSTKSRYGSSSVS